MTDMTEAQLLDKVVQCMAAHKNDVKVQSLLDDLEAHLKKKKEHTERLNEVCVLNPPRPIFGSLSEPETFMEGFAATLDRLSLFIHLAKKRVKAIDIAFLEEQVKGAVACGLTDNYACFYDEECSEQLLKVVEAMERVDQREVERAAEQKTALSFENEIASLEMIVQSFNKDRLAEKEARLQLELARLQTIKFLIVGVHETPPKNTSDADRRLLLETSVALKATQLAIDEVWGDYNRAVTALVSLRTKAMDGPGERPLSAMSGLA